MPNSLRFDSKILSLQDSNDVYMTLNMVVCSSQTNLNKARFTESFIENYGKTLIDQPLTVDRESLENGDYEGLTHLFDPISNQLKTDPIGVIVETWSEKDEDGVLLLYATAKIWKRFRETCMAIMELYSSENLRFSCEVLVEESSNNGDGTYDIVKGDFIGHTIVSFPAEVRAKAQLLVAEALNNDFEKEASNLEDNVKIVNQEEPVVSEFSFEQISEMIWMKLNEDGEYKYWLMRTYADYVIIQSNEDGKLWKVMYALEDGEVMLEMEGAKEVMIDFVEVSEDMAEIFEDEKYMKPDENLAKLNELQEKYDNAIKSNDAFEVKINELNETIVKINENVAEKDAKIEELNTFKVELDEIKELQRLAEIAAKKSEISEMVQKTGLFTEEEIAEELAEFIESCDEISINARIAKKVIEKMSDVEVEEKIVVNANLDGDDLLPEKDEIVFEKVK